MSNGKDELYRELKKDCEGHKEVRVNELFVIATKIQHMLDKVMFVKYQV